MSIEERLEKLTERHEALSQTVEIVVGMQRENERRMAETDRRMAETDQRVRTLTDLMAGLVELVRRHEERLDNLDSR